MASVYPMGKNFIAIGAIKIDKDNRYETEIYAGHILDVLRNLNDFLQVCLMDGSESQTRPISRKGFYDYANHFIADYRKELIRLESKKKKKGIEHITTRLVSIMRKRPELDEFANSLPPGDEHRKKLRKKIYLLDQQISSLNEGMDENQLQSLCLHSSPCDVDLSCLGVMKRLPYLSDFDRETIESFRRVNPKN